MKDGIGKYIFIFFLYVKNSLIGYLEYGANFFMEFLSECVYILLKVVYIVAICNSSKNIAGFSSNYVLVLGGNYLILTGIFVGFFMMNFFELSNQIRQGDLDLAIVKPISLQFTVSFRQFQFGALIPDVIAGIVLIAIGLPHLNVVITPVNVVKYLVMMIAAVVLIYSVFFLLQMSSFWFVKTESLTTLFENLWDYNNMPMQIYGKRIAAIGIFIVPLFAISNFPIMCFVGTIKTSMFIWGIVAAILFMIVSRVVWKKAIKHYSSASS